MSSLPLRGQRQRPRRRLNLSLRLQVALVIMVFSLLPNLVMAVAVLLPAYQRSGGISTAEWLTLVLWLLGMVMLSVLIGYVLSGQLLAPLLRLTGDIAKLGRALVRGTEARLPVTGEEPHEVLRLRHAFNELLEQVQLEQSRRNSFMATLMHDLKTPLVATNHLLAVVRDNERLSRDERIEVVTQLSEQNRALIDLVQKMVDAHKFDRDEVELALEPTDLGALARAVVTRVRPLALERGVTIEVQGEGEATVDPKEFERALGNLVGNAVRYAHSSIRIELYPGVVRIADDGPGLPAPLDVLAQPFNAQPVEIAGRRYTAGTGGLGLFIARRIIEAHGGRLVTEVTSSRGTVLLIYLGPPSGAKRG